MLIVHKPFIKFETVNEIVKTRLIILDKGINQKIFVSVLEGLLPIL